MSGQPIRMLSLDDRTMTTDLDRAGYRKMGVFVRPAANYEEAERLLSTESIDIVVINNDYARVDAVQVTKHLKSTEAWKSIPVVVTSVQTAAKVRNAALEAGADLFVEQPLPRQYFIEKLKQLLEQKTRTTERVDVQSEVVMEIDGSEIKCPIGDLSVSGILLVTATRYESGKKVTLHLELPGAKKPVTVTGEIVRSIAGDKARPDVQTGVGIRFLKFQADGEKRLEKYIAKTADSSSRLIYYL